MGRACTSCGSTCRRAVIHQHAARRSPRSAPRRAGRQTRSRISCSRPSICRRRTSRAKPWSSASTAASSSVASKPPRPRRASNEKVAFFATSASEGSPPPTWGISRSSALKATRCSATRSQRLHRARASAACPRGHTSPSLLSSCRRSCARGSGRAHPNGSGVARQKQPDVLGFPMSHHEALRAAKVPGPRVPFEVFRALPKTDLHVHLDGSLRLETILDIARREKVELPADDVDGLRAAIGCGREFGSLTEYLRGFDITLRVMQTEEALERIAFELAEDAHAENVRYMEVRYAPMLHTRLGL